jgi:choline-sulfatase
MNKIRRNRRDFLKATGAAVSSVFMPRLVFGRQKAVSKPNIMVIMSDEHNASVTGSYGNDIVRTANLDGLSRSRLSFTSGKYVSRIGAWSNSCLLVNADCPSLPRIMNAAGYESVLCGKMHYDRTRRYGFREIGGNMNNSRKTGKGGRRKAGDLAPKAGMSGRFGNFHTGDKSSILTHDRKVTAGTVEFLKNQKAGDKPFFLFVGYLAPHFPLIVPEKYWKQYKGKVPMPEIPEGHLEAQPRNYKHLRIGFNVENVPDDTVRKGRELYYGLTQWLDVEIGKVLETLGNSEAADNTVVIYTTDHGENMGEHGLWWKNCMYEHSSRLPLIVSWPSIAELGRAEVPGDWDGDSMVRWLDNAKIDWKDVAISEYYSHNIASGFAMIRMGKYKYVYHTAADESHPAERELYDLESDPGEFKNLAGQSKHKRRIVAMHSALVKELGEEPDRTEKRCRADYARGYSRSDRKSKKKKRT